MPLRKTAGMPAAAAAAAISAGLAEEAGVAAGVRDGSPPRGRRRSPRGGGQHPGRARVQQRAGDAVPAGEREHRVAGGGFERDHPADSLRRRAVARPGEGPTADRPHRRCPRRAIVPLRSLREASRSRRRRTGWRRSEEPAHDPAGDPAGAGGISGGAALAASAACPGAADGPAARRPGFGGVSGKQYDQGRCRDTTHLGEGGTTAPVHTGIAIHGRFSWFGGVLMTFQSTSLILPDYAPIAREASCQGGM